MQVSDDFAHTPLHDACWTMQPNFWVINILLQCDQQLLFLDYDDYSDNDESDYDSSRESMEDVVVNDFFMAISACLKVHQRPWFIIFYV